MKHKVRRIISLASVLAVGACALGMFAGCTTNHPEVTITYSFNGKDYSVSYTLSRNDAPKTVQHFIELADAGYYDGMCIHNYTSSAMYSGGYKLVDGELEEVDYFSAVKKLEEEQNITFTQSVWTADENKTPLYTVYGEFYENGVDNEYSRENTHSAGALVMYYTGKDKFNGDVTVERADGGKNNDGNATQNVRYKLNSATSLFYTYRSTSNTQLDRSFCVFGMADADDYQNELVDGLFAAIEEYEKTLSEGTTFTTEQSHKINTFEPFEEVRTSGAEETFQVPVDMPIIVKTVVGDKY